ncbi:MMPL family transporter [uncultured Pseudokineococcus sp.]|uniref:MMPL family transporter n=1 Tax=uncultured Pseudokineococcus sp. TaxID=1642928 RepID=UPI002604D860|nr:MMPL family transporter [uncultured Pseudokineococcus sp.]
MSTSLYALGSLAARRWRVVVVVWLLVLAVAGTGALTLSKGLTNTFSIPGTESQEALDRLSQTFPEVSGGSAQLVVVARDGRDVDDEDVRRAVADLVTAAEDLPQVAAVSSPFADVGGGSTSPDRTAVIVPVQMEVGADEVAPETLDALVATAASASGEAVDVVAGGGVFGGGTPGITLTEVLGLVVALVVLVLTLGSLVAAGMPILTALVGVGVAMSLLLASTAVVEVSSTAPLLALMIGLAVGIDYALFVLTRHRDHLADGVEPVEAAGRAVATAGSAVVFAGLTVMIALAGLSVVGIPFLTTMGLASAVAVAVAVCVALTLLPAVAGALGARLTPRPRRPRRSRSGRGAAGAEAEGAGGHAAPRPAHPVADRWTGLVTRRPLVTTLLVVLGLGAVALPALDLRLALPDNGSSPEETTQRQAYDLVSEEFGAGFNGPLIVTGDIVTSTDPLGLVEDVADALRALPDVADIPLATPNPGADTMIVQVVPEEGPSSESTEQLVADIRDRAPELEDELGVSIAVTGQTAVGIDVSDQLSSSLLPFALLVVGLSVVLLTMVFRSVLVPLKATAGYLLSVVAAFGAIVAVYQWGWLAGPLHTSATGPIISFLPIILMGLLFGLAMDYEVFLVSRMREDHAHGAPAQEAVRSGFAASSRVVVAAAVIMVSVFAAFVPEGDATLQPIAFGLAVGVFIDAFVVRMTLVPAVMALLGERAWWLPGWLARRLPVLDVEGEGLAHQVALRDWPHPGARGVHAQDLGLAAAREQEPALVAGAEVHVEPGALLLVTSPSPGTRTALALLLSGRAAPSTGRLVADGLVLPEQARSARRRVALVRAADVADAAEHVRAAARGSAAVLVLDGLELVPAAQQDGVLADVVDACRDTGLAAVVTTSPAGLDAATSAAGAHAGGAVPVDALVLPAPHAPLPPSGHDAPAPGPTAGGDSPDDAGRAPDAPSDPRLEEVR